MERNSREVARMRRFGVDSTRRAASAATASTTCCSYPRMSSIRRLRRKFTSESSAARSWASRVSMANRSQTVCARGVPHRGRWSGRRTAPRQEGAPELIGRPDRQARLTHATGADGRDQPVLAEERAEFAGARCAGRQSWSRVAESPGNSTATGFAADRRSSLRSRPTFTRANNVRDLVQPICRPISAMEISGSASSGSRMSRSAAWIADPFAARWSSGLRQRQCAAHRVARHAQPRPRSL